MHCCNYVFISLNSNGAFVKFDVFESKLAGKHLLDKSVFRSDGDNRCFFTFVAMLA